MAGLMSFNDHDLPDEQGHFGPYGGRFVAETLIYPLRQLEESWFECCDDLVFQAELDDLLKNYVGRPSPLYFAKNLSAELGGAAIYLKREDLNHTGAHKINNALGQALLAKRMGKTRVIAETGAGQHGVAAATAAALLGLECVIFMGEKDMARQSPNVYRIRLLGAEVVPVVSASRTLKDAMNEAMRDWVATVENTFYIIGTVAGPHPYPLMTRHLQSVIGRETAMQLREITSKDPAALIACIGGGSNAIGLFAPFIANRKIKLYGVEAAGEGIASGRHAASIAAGKRGVLHGNRTYLLADEDGQILQTHSLSAGLDYPGVGPEHAWLHDSGRCKYVTATDEQALRSFHRLCRSEGIIPALESSHALAYAEELAPQLSREDYIVVNLSGRGDKDLETVAKLGA